jgi:hypothetical protein
MTELSGQAERMADAFMSAVKEEEPEAETYFVGSMNGEDV